MHELRACTEGVTPSAASPACIPFPTRATRRFWVFRETVELLGTTCPSKLEKIQHSESSPQKVPQLPPTCPLSFLLVPWGLAVTLPFKQELEWKSVPRSPKKTCPARCQEEVSMAMVPSTLGTPPASSGLHLTPTLPPHLCNRCVTMVSLRPTLLGISQ